MVNLAAEEDALEQAFPFERYEQDKTRIRELVVRLEKEYDLREQAIGRIMKYGTGIESQNALRACPIPVLERWEAVLKRSRKEGGRDRLVGSVTKTS